MRGGIELSYRPTACGGKERRSKKIQIASLLAAPAGGGRRDREACPATGCHHAVTEGLLVLIPSRAPHLFHAPLAEPAKPDMRAEGASPSPVDGRDDRAVHLIPVGRAAVLVEVETTKEAISLAAWARERSLARDVVPGATTVLLDGLAEGDGLADVLADWSPTAVATSASPISVINPVVT